MTKTNPDNRDQVLIAFHEACPRPTAEQIIEWTHRFPRFANDIRADAAVSRDWDASKDFPAEEPDEAMLARGFSQVLNALYNAEVSAPSSASPLHQSFDKIIAARGKDVRQLAREMDIERGVLADLLSGRMLPPVGERLVAAFISALSMTREAFDAALQAVLHAPRIGFAKAEQAPTVVPRSYETIIRDSSMSADRKRYWLRED